MLPALDEEPADLGEPVLNPLAPPLNVPPIPANIRAQFKWDKYNAWMSDFQPFKMPETTHPNLERAAEIQRGEKEGTGESFLRNAVQGVADVLTLGGAARKVGLGVKTYLATIGARSYDSSLKQADEEGLSGASKQTFAGIN